MSDSDDHDEDHEYQSFEFESDYEDEYFDNQSENSSSSTRSHNERVSPSKTSTSFNEWTLPKFILTVFLDKYQKLKDSKLGGCTDDDLLILLHYKRWQADEVINDFFDNPKKLFEQAGLPVPPQKSANHLKSTTSFDCSVCCESYKQVMVYELSCSHRYCLFCYHHYIYNELSTGKLIHCIQPDCALTIPHGDIDKIFDIVEHDSSIIKITKPLNENRLLVASAKIFVDSQSTYKWCPAPDCKGFTELVSSATFDEATLDYKDISIIPIVRCAESHEFCFSCNYENHLPCPCWVVKKWIKKCQDDSETINWIDANTSACPNCLSSIEKNGGCNHMTCKKCHHEFCWVCLGNWSEHNNSYYKCNKFEQDMSEIEMKKSKSRLTLQRYLHFYKRFTIHESSMQGDLKVLKQINNVAVMYLESRRKDSSVTSLAWSDIQFLPDAIRALSNGRKTLKWTYCFAYYLMDSNFQEIFESNQDYLNRTVEDLSEIFEKITTTSTKGDSDIVKLIMKNKTKIINLSNTISLRQKTLIDGAYHNLKEGLMKFDA
ncbi:uncharacterized protein CANTADRAFT_96545 [Suhomyces tanzawaensis NRRL Y-17324]|uniref:RBR-type E3 ubiquitin transferase n=1 Tax=Suhomyces tanzawaensis NRRL Y-17324 TaxID=984487 RepID=A0A1E4SEC5_9ASCO|nr:uncharacterized protein CANTADRAFT_96545 [Suhomyces tanzawaensis NRRL Y-17324]ODV77871.1 hypothetical protein CANTADRAFT_96545 [Suhomyces tanzawaensis NRRL Y-17324]